MVKTDAELMIAFQTGDRESFDLLLKRHHVGLYNFFIRMVGNAAEAEDLTQEVFIKVFRHAARYRQTAKFTTYLYRIAKNTWLDWLRKRKRRGVMVSLDQDDGDGYNLYRRIAGRSKDPLDALLSSETGQQVHAAITGLSEEHRLVFVLAEVQGMAYAEIAETLDIPEGTVKSRMHNAVHKLRERLKHLQRQ